MKIFLGRLVATFVAGFCAWLLTKTGITIQPEDQLVVRDGILVILMVVFTAVYGVVHKLIDKKVNPGDAASEGLAKKETIEAKAL